MSPLLPSQGRTEASPPSAATMTAATLVAPGRIELERVPVPTPAAQEVRVRLEGCGVCASNLPPWEGRPWFEYPMAPGQLGHEGWGVVDAVGQNVTGLAVGDRVAMLSNHAYAEYDVAAEQQVVKLTPAPSSAVGCVFPGEPLGCAVNIFKRCGIGEGAGQSVAILGIGFLGALLTQLAKAAGARVIAISRRPYSLAIARQMGADEAILMDEPGRVIQQVAELTAGRGGYEVSGFCDRVIECTGKEEPLQLAGELCGVRARLIIAGYHQDGLRSVNLQLWNWRGLDVINAHERDPAIYLEGIREAAALIARGTLDPAPLYTHTFTLAQLGDALQMTHDRPDGFVKALVRMPPP